MQAALTRWETSIAPIIAIEPTESQAIAVYWGAIIPAIPDLVSLEQSRTGMSYETALHQLLQAQQKWVQQLHGESRFTLSLRLITTGNPAQNLILGLVGKTEGQDETETINAARNFFNKIRDTVPNGYPLEHCHDQAALALLRLPFLPQTAGALAELRRSLTPLQTISHTDLPNRAATLIHPWNSQAGTFQELFRAFTCHSTPAALSITLRPTQLTPQESTTLAEWARLYANIANISRSDSTQVGSLNTNVTVQDKRGEAEQASQLWTQLQASWRSPFEMTISLMADSDLPQSIVAAMQAAVSGKPSTDAQAPGRGEIIAARSEAQKMASRQNWVDLTLHRWANTHSLDRLPWLFSAEEIHSLWRLPIADRNGVWGLPSAVGANDARRPPSMAEGTADLRLGGLRLTTRQLTQHLLISGVPGSGKTNTSLYLLETLWREHHIPWMVLEPAKTEYRGLQTVASLADDLLIFTLGDERIAPFRFNPFELPPDISLDSHMGALLDLLSVSMSMWGPLPNVVEQLLSEAYKRKGFTLLGDNTSLQPPTFADLAALIPEIVPKLGYKKETTDEITAAIAVRLHKFCRGALGRMLNTRQSFPFDALMQRPVILEMSQMTNTDDRAFVMGLLLNRCYQYWMARRHEATGELKHLLLVEEAHNLLANGSESANQEQANPKGKAVRNFANMLAEVRGFGQGIAIAEQNPEGLVPDVMVNTNIKLAHRLVEARNREALGRSMLLTPQQEKSLASLNTGQLLYYIGGSPEPSLTTVPNFKDADNGFNPRLTDAAIQTQFQHAFQRSFQAQHPDLYALPIGCPTAPHLSACLEQGADLVEMLATHPHYKLQKQTVLLHLLAAPFGALVIDFVHPILGRLLIERGANHLSAEQVQGIFQSALSLLALEAVQAKGKTHGWLGQQIHQAHTVLVNALHQTDPSILSQWINLCQIPDHLLALGLPHPQYAACEAPGVFRYENRILLEGDRTVFSQLLRDQNNTAASALQQWAATTVVMGILSDSLKHSLITCLAIQMTENSPNDLQHFIG